MSYETIIDQIKTVPEEKLGELEAFIITLKSETKRAHCRGIAKKYANSALISQEAEAASNAFSGEYL